MLLATDSQHHAWPLLPVEERERLEVVCAGQAPIQGNIVQETGNVDFQVMRIVKGELVGDYMGISMDLKTESKYRCRIASIWKAKWYQREVDWTSGGHARTATADGRGIDRLE